MLDTDSERYVDSVEKPIIGHSAYLKGESPYHTEIDNISTPEEERDPYTTCKTGLDGCYFGPITDSTERVDGNMEKYTVGQETIGHTHFRLGDASRYDPKWTRLKKLDDGTSPATYAGETTKGPHRVNDREVYTTRRADSVACQVGLSRHHRQLVQRLVAEEDIRAWNFLGGIDPAIGGAVAYAVKDSGYIAERADGTSFRRQISDAVDSLNHPAVKEAAELLGLDDPQAVVERGYERYCGLS